jgi:hypothetical protein
MRVKELADAEAEESERRREEKAQLRKAEELQLQLQRQKRWQLLRQRWTGRSSKSKTDGTASRSKLSNEQLPASPPSQHEEEQDGEGGEGQEDKFGEGVLPDGGTEEERGRLQKPKSKARVSWSSFVVWGGSSRSKQRQQEEDVEGDKEGAVEQEEEEEEGEEGDFVARSSDNGVDEPAVVDAVDAGSGKLDTGSGKLDAESGKLFHHLSLEPKPVVVDAAAEGGEGSLEASPSRRDASSPSALDTAAAKVIDPAQEAASPAAAAAAAAAVEIVVGAGAAAAALTAALAAGEAATTAAAVAATTAEYRASERQKQPRHPSQPHSLLMSTMLSMNTVSMGMGSSSSSSLKEKKAREKSPLQGYRHLERQLECFEQSVIIVPLEKYRRGKTTHTIRRTRATAIVALVAATVRRAGSWTGRTAHFATRTRATAAEVSLVRMLP